MGQIPSTIPPVDPIGVVHHTWIGGAWRNATSTEYADDATVGDVLIDSGAASAVALGPDDVLTVFIRGHAAASAYHEISNMGEKLVNYTHHYSTDGYLYFRFGKTNRCPPSCTGMATVLINVINNGNGTHDLIFSDGSSATVGTFGGSPGPVGPDGADGADGNSITSIIDHGDGTITINMTNLPPFTTSNFTGPAGSDGLPGVPGNPGIPGSNGTNGVDGTDGTNGTNGTNGVDGSPGAPGLPGSPGAPGTPGAPGVDGVDGADADTIATVVYDPLTGTLLITMASGATFTTGDLRGAATTIDIVVYHPNGTITLTFTDGTSVLLPAATGIATLVDNGNGILTITLTDGSSVVWNASVVGPSASQKITLSYTNLWDNGDGTYSVEFRYQSVFNPVATRIPIGVATNVLELDIAGTFTPYPHGSIAQITEWFTPGNDRFGFVHTWTGGVIRWTILSPDGVLESVGVPNPIGVASPRPWAHDPPSGSSLSIGSSNVWINNDGTYTADFTYSNGGALTPIKIPLGPTTNYLQDQSGPFPYIKIYPDEITTWFVPGGTVPAFSYTWDGQMLGWVLNVPGFASNLQLVSSASAILRPH